LSYYLLHFIRIINDLIIKAILNQYVPIVKIIGSTILTSKEKWKEKPKQHAEKTELIIK
jgi:hypothetical protein